MTRSAFSFVLAVLLVAPVFSLSDTVIATETAAISQRKALYGRYLDQVHITNGSVPAATAFASLFTDDALLDVGPVGVFYNKSQIYQAARTVFPAGISWSHFLFVTPIIEVQYPRYATGDWYFSAPFIARVTPFFAPPFPAVGTFYGSFKEIYVKCDNVWKFKEVHVQVSIV
mmetsp:Transcript_18602/g.30961  ORF Transcript_18602/g.30961 Transcript_18602/m.30961 type:complete len:172 (+) Transcript_18602:191-706(+)|eukprot:CAMPEP_0184346198 /NCGR_PEP_ID=MMETSP1089-20130417/14492_1 /TAXON_ID=38269 ORGANISM="Gloeochaete wittrockiana, Strain SAG46.84" /NCGR_SAMPLE_ID=MMETSP1089 /ASSEMBLY_ACC=CAM_ASM_000445 /LENGTH=171 /DNA_ID=CAMNT_0026676779 /DNA_START=98 /DNA_END=613 /DNA_ORIENTATION=-